MDKQLEEQHLAEAEKHLSEAQARIIQQKEVVLRLTRDGHDTSAAVALLEEMQKTVLAMEEHYAELLAKSRLETKRDSNSTQ